MNRFCIIGIIFGVLFYNNFLYAQEMSFSNLQWRNNEAEIQEAHADDNVIIRFETINIPDNVIIDIEIWEETDGRLMDFINKLQGTVRNDIVEFDWVIEFDMNNENTNYAREIEEIGYTFIDYVFLVKYGEISISSKSLAILAWGDYLLVDQNGEPIRNSDFMIWLPDNRRGRGEFTIGRTNDEGRAIMRNLRKIGHYRLIR